MYPGPPLPHSQLSRSTKAPLRRYALSQVCSRCMRRCSSTGTAVKRARAAPAGVTGAQIVVGTASPYASRKPLDVDAAVAQLREIADGRGDLLAERAGVILGFHDEDARDGRWPRRALEAALCIAAAADLTGLTEWIAAGQEPAQRIR
jgi:hypothetical protein